MSYLSDEFRAQAARDLREARKPEANGSKELLIARAKAYKALAENEMWLRGEQRAFSPSRASVSEFAWNERPEARA